MIMYDLFTFICSLVLHIYAPPLPADKTALPNGYPVLFFIHGGDFQFGGAGYKTLDGTNFALNNIIFVSINYRVGFLGFFAATGLNGNYGIYDQIMALKWVNKNIAEFGGDPNRITIDGQSAGAMSVAMHMASPLTVGLFSGGIMESTYFYNVFFPNISVVRDRGNSVIIEAQKQTGITCNIACLRNIQVDFILQVQDKTNAIFTFQPAVGTAVLPIDPTIAFKIGKVQNIPILVGSNSGEGRSYAFQVFPNAKTKDLYEAALHIYLGPVIAQMVNQTYPYPADPNFDYRYLLSDVATDGIFYCPLRYALDNLYKNRAKDNSIQPTYMYEYKHVASTPCQPIKYPYCVDIACHGYELPLVFDNLICEASDGRTVTSLNATAEERTLSLSIQSAWVNFVYSGNPNDGPMQATVIRPFPLYDVVNRSLVRLDYPDSSTYSATNFKDSVCSSMWDKVYDFIV